jgi:hypothetical protein
MTKNLVSVARNLFTSKTTASTPELATPVSAPVVSTPAVSTTPVTHVVIVKGAVTTSGTLTECMAWAKENHKQSPVIKTVASHTRVTTPVAAPGAEVRDALVVLSAAGYAKWHRITQMALRDEPLSTKQVAVLLSAAAKEQGKVRQAKWDGLWKVLDGAGNQVATAMRYTDACEVYKTMMVEFKDKDAQLVKTNNG